MSSSLDPAATAPAIPAAAIPAAASRPLLAGLAPGDQVEIDHEVKVGWRVWRSTTRGLIVSIDRRRHGLHNERNFDDKVYSDVIVLRRDDGELTTVTLDEFSVVRKLT